MRGDTWYLDYVKNGQRVRRSAGKNKVIAEAVLRRIESNQAIEKFLPGQVVAAPGPQAVDLAIEDLLGLYLAYAETNCRPGSLRRYRENANRFKKFCKEQFIPTVGALNLEVAEHYKAARVKDGAAPATINGETTFVVAALNYAKRLGRIPANPWEGIRKLRVVKLPPRVYSKDEIEKILEGLPEWACDAVTILVNTGMRFGELQNLTWQDVDLERGMIQIASRNGHETKTGGTWAIPILDVVDEILRRREKLKRAYVVMQPRSKKSLHNARLRDLFQARLKELGLDHGRIHDLRHTFASRLAESGAPLGAIKELLGHADERTTAIYKHLSPAYLREEMERLNLDKKKARPE